MKSVFKSVRRRLSGDWSSKTSPNVEVEQFGLHRIEARSQPLTTLHEAVEDRSIHQSSNVASTLSRTEVQDYHVDIVAVHGLGGHAFNTWTHRNSTMWLRDFALDELPKARIYTFGYNSAVAFSRNTSSIRHYAAALLEALAAERRAPEHRTRPIIFVCHSLGGIVVKQAIIKANNDSAAFSDMRDISQSVEGIVFLGTPHRGSSSADYSRILSLAVNAVGRSAQVTRFTGSTRTDLLNALRTNSRDLLSMGEDFSRLAGGFAIASFIETNRMPGMDSLIVDDSSGFIGFPRERKIHLQDRDHREIAKYSSLRDAGLQSILSSIKSMSQNAIARSNAGRRTLIRSLPYPRNQDFIGRSDLLTQIDRRLSRESGRRRLGIYGLGGVGKTELAIEYAHGKIQQNPDLRVFFISAETRDTFVRDYKEIAKILDIGQHDPSYDYEVDEFALVRQKLDSGDILDWLIIVDNADNLDLLMEANGHRPSDSDLQTDRGLLDYIPHSRVGSVLYTTRSRTNALQLTNHGSAIHIKGIDPEEAITLFKAKLDSDTSDEDIWPAILRELEYLPLAIVQVAAYIRHSSYSISQTLDIIKREDSDSLSDIFTFDLSNHLRMTRTARIPAITFKTWISTVQYLEHHNQRAVQLLGRMSLYGHCAIPDRLLRLGNESENQFQSAIGTLTAFSLITVMRGPGTCREQYQVNRLVRLFMRHWLRDLRSPTEEWARDALLTLNCHFHGDDKTYDGSSTGLVRHAGSVISFQSACVLQPNEYALLVRKAIFYLEREQNWSLAEAYAASAIKFLRNSVGSKHKASLNVERLLYDVQYESGSQVKTLVAKQENLWQEQIQELGRYHRDTLETVVSLLCTLCKQRQFTEADRFLAQVLESGEPSDLENRYVLRAFGRSFWSIMDKRDYRKGQQTFRDAWKVLLADEIFTETDFWKDMTDRAHNLLEQGKFKASTVILIEILNVAEFGRQSLQHPRAAVNMKQLASAFQGLNKQEDARRYLRIMWELQKQNLGSEHLDTLESLTILADNLRKQLEHEKARDHYLEALELYSRFHRSKNVAILQTTVNLGRTLFELKQFEQAEQRFLEAVKLIDSSPTLVVERKEYLFRKLGACCQHQQRAGEAARFFEKAFEIYLEKARPVHNNSVITFTGLATTYLDIEEYGRADRLIEDVLGLVPKLEKSESADAPSAWYLVAELLGKRKRYVEAADLFERAYEGFKQKLGPTHKRTMECMFLAGHMSFAAREYQDAASRYQRYLDLQKQCKHCDHKNTSRAHFNIGNCMVQQALLEDAIKSYTKSYEIALEHLGFGHPRTVRSRTELDNAHRLYDAQKPAKGILGKKRSTIEGSNARGNGRQPLKNVSNERKSVQFVEEAVGSGKETSRGRRSVVRATFDAAKLHSDSETG